MTRCTRWLYVCLCLCCSAVGCQAQGADEGGQAAPAKPDKPGWLNGTDREILKLQLELAAGEPDLTKRSHAIAGALAEIEKGRLPVSWTETAFIVSKASAPVAAKMMWKTLISKSDVAPLATALCWNGPSGLENIARVAKDAERVGGTATAGDLVFKHCKAKEIGFLDKVGDSQHVALAFAAIAFNHLKSNNTMSPEEADALRMFVRYFSEFYESKLIRRRAPRPTAGPASVPPATASGASASAAPQGPAPNKRPAP